MSSTRDYLRIKGEYRRAHRNQPAKPAEIIDWAIGQGLFQIDERKARRRAARELATAMRGEMTVDAHGNAIRVNLAFKSPTQGWLWDERTTISRGAIQLHLTRGRRMVYSEIRAQVLTANDYTENHPDEPPVQYSLNFVADLADDGITLPVSIGLEQLFAPPPSGLADSAPRPEPDRPSPRPLLRVSRRKRSDPSSSSHSAGESLGPDQSPPA